MARVKRGTLHLKKRRALRKATKGYKWHGKNTIKAREALFHAGGFAFDDRKTKKRNFRKLWTVKINALLREKFDLTYSKFINLLSIKNIEIDRKILADLAENNEAAFAKIVEKVK